MSSSPREAGTERRELRHELGNALTAVSAQAQFLWHRLPAWADARERQALVAIQDGLLRAGRLLKPAPADFPATGCDLQTLVALASSQVPPERAPEPPRARACRDAHDRLRASRADRPGPGEPAG
jgi:hypothetical protein